MRSHRVIALAALAVLAGCGSTSSSTSSTAGASSSAGAGTGPTAGATPAAAGCSLAPASLVNSTFGTTVTDASPEVNGTVTLCHYSNGANPSAVLIRFATGMSLTDFKANEAGFAAHGESTTDISGLGDAAYSSTIGTGASAVNTVVALKSNTEVLITASQPLTKVQALSQALLSAL